MSDRSIDLPPAARPEHLYLIFGADAEMLANDLDVAARQYREHAEQLTARQPDGLITAAGAAHLAAGHRLAAERCDRAAHRIRTLLGYPQDRAASSTS